MTADLTVPKRWIEGHLSDLEFREAGAERAIHAALSDADARTHVQDLAEIRAAKQAWREVLHRTTEPATTHHRPREHR